MAAAAMAMANLLIAERERERYENDPAYRMEVLQGEEASLRKKIDRDTYRMQNPGCCCGVLFNPAKAYDRHTARLNEVLAAEAQTAPLIPASFAAVPAFMPDPS